MAKAKRQRTEIRKGHGLAVEGVPEFQRALKIVDLESRKGFRTGMKGIAKMLIGVAEGRGAPPGYLKPAVGQYGAGISFPAGGKGSGKDDQGHYPWLEWGGAPATGRGVTSSGRRYGAEQRAFRREWVGTQGRWLYPSIDDYSSKIEEGFAEIVEDACHRADLEVSG
jgi:hypothetical protein